MALSVAEGVLYAVMVGFGDAYFLADAVRLGASPLQQGLVVTLPLFAGALGSVAALALLRNLPRRRPVVLAGALVQVVVLLTLVALHAARRMAPEVLILLAALHQMGGQCAGTAWSSWYGDLVPSSIRGRYFARRGRFTYAATCLGLVTSGLLLHRLEAGAPGTVQAGAGGYGFCAVFGVAAVARLASAVLLALSPEPPYRGLPAPRRLGRFLSTLRGRSARRLLLLGAALQLTVYLGSPYFGPFMLDGLHFTYAQYMIASVAVVMTKVIVLPAWGRAVDAHGPRAVYALALVLIAIVPLPWLVAEGLLVVIFAQALSGASWGAYEVGYFSLVLETTTKSARPYIFAAQNVLHGTMQLTGSLVGAWLLAAFDRSFATLFAITAVARGIVAAVAPRIVPPLGAGGAMRRRTLLLRVIGIRPHGGVVHRPIGAVDDGVEA